MSSRSVDCGLGAWVHSEATLPDLSAAVERMWHFDGSMSRARERIFPGHTVEIIVHLGERYSDVEGGRVSICPAACVTGLRLGPAVIEAPANRTAVLGIRLTVPGAYALFGRPMNDTLGLTVDLHDLVGAAAAELHDACGAASGARECFVRAAGWIAARLRLGTRAHPAVAWTLEQIRLSGGTASISNLRERIGFSRNRMAATFREQAGLTPKQFARIVRFRAALEGLHTRAASLSGLAHDAGYYDQPHMSAEFKALSGMTPGEFLRSLRYPHSVSVAE